MLRLRAVGGGSPVLGAALTVLWPVLVGHHVARVAVGVSPVTAARGAFLAAGAAVLHGMGDWSWWGAGWRVSMLVWAAGWTVWPRPGVDDPVLVPRPVDRVWATRIEGEQPWNPVGDVAALVVAVGWWVLALPVGASVLTGRSVPWTVVGVLAAGAAAIWSTRYEPAFPPVT